MGGAAVEVWSRGVRGAARKKSGETVVAEERSCNTGREGYARDEETRDIARVNCRLGNFNGDGGPHAQTRAGRECRQP